MKKQSSRSQPEAGAAKLHVVIVAHSALIALITRRVQPLSGCMNMPCNSTPPHRFTQSPEPKFFPPSVLLSLISPSFWSVLFLCFISIPLLTTDPISFTDQRQRSLKMTCRDEPPTPIRRDGPVSFYRLPIPTLFHSVRIPTDISAVQPLPQAQDQMRSRSPRRGL